MTAETEVVAALEKVLEAGPTAWGVFAMVDGEMTIQYPVALSPASAKGHADMYRGETIEIRPLYTTDPLAIRTLLDAHASALRDAAELRERLEVAEKGARRWALHEDDLSRIAAAKSDDSWKREAKDIASAQGGPAAVRFIRSRCGLGLREAYDIWQGISVRAALDDNTKGAAE